MFFFKNIFQRKNRIESYSVNDSINDDLQEVDMNNIISSIFHAESLYNKAKTKCHPDRFSNDEILMKKADDIFKELTKNKRDLKKMQEIVLIAEKELNIKILDHDMQKL